MPRTRTSVPRKAVRLCRRHYPFQGMGRRRVVFQASAYLWAVSLSMAHQVFAPAPPGQDRQSEVTPGLWTSFRCPCLLRIEVRAARELVIWKSTLSTKGWHDVRLRSCFQLRRLHLPSVPHCVSRIGKLTRSTTEGCFKNQPLHSESLFRHFECNRDVTPIRHWTTPAWWSWLA